MQPIDSTDPKRIQAFIREVIAAHPKDYASPDGWQENTVEALMALVPPRRRGLLSALLTPTETTIQAVPKIADAKRAGRDQLGI